jgi:hypothetical protein
MPDTTKMNSRAATMPSAATRLSKVPTQPGRPRRADSRRSGWTVIDNTSPRNTDAIRSENARTPSGSQGGRDRDDDNHPRGAAAAGCPTSRQPMPVVPTIGVLSLGATQDWRTVQDSSAGSVVAPYGDSDRCSPWFHHRRRRGTFAPVFRYAHHSGPGTHKPRRCSRHREDRRSSHWRGSVPPAVSDTDISFRGLNFPPAPVGWANMCAWLPTRGATPRRRVGSACGPSL